MHAHHHASAIGRFNGDGPPRDEPSGKAPDPFLDRLRTLAGLDDQELDALAGLYGPTRQVRAKAELPTPDQHPRRLHVLLDGWACRYRLLRDGRRQITQLLLPGDVCDLDALHLRTRDLQVTALTPSTFVALDGTALRTLASQRQRIGDALGWLAAVENAMLAERNVSLGRRSAREHLAHLLCELMVRLAVVRHGSRRGYTLPITQEELADVLGLTSVHVNRMLQSLRSDRLIEQNGSAVTIRDWDDLQRAGGFRPDYLHLEGVDGGAEGRGSRPWAFAAEPSREPHQN